jgi:hypothetical protein
MRTPAFAGALLSGALSLLAASCAGFPDASHAAKAVERFSLGWYDGITRLGMPRYLAERGFDLVMPYVGEGEPAAIAAYLGAAEAAGVDVFLELPRSRVASEEQSAIEEYIDLFSGSPAVKGWYLYDEPEWKLSVGRRRLETSYERIKARDGYRGIALVFMFQGLAGRYSRAMDEFWFDNYPIASWSREFSAFRGGRFADRMIAVGRSADRLGKDLRLVLQGYGADSKGEPQFYRRLPTAAEMRYMFYAALLARPRGILFWTLYRTREEWMESVLLPIIGEFRERFPRGIEYREPDGFVLEGLHADELVLGDGSGRLWLMVASRSAASGVATISGPAGRSVELRFGPYEVRFLELSPEDGGLASPVH